MARDITTIINNLNTESHTIPERNWSDIAIGTLSDNSKIILAVNSNSGTMAASRDNGTTWETYELGYNNNIIKVAWSKTMKRFCAIMYDSNRYLLSAPITTLNGNLENILNFEIRNFNDCPSLVAATNPNSKWYDVVWAEKPANSSIETTHNYDNFLLVTRDSPYIFVSVIENGDIVDWKPTTLIENEKAFLDYNWKELISTNISDVDGRTDTTKQFLMLGLDSSYRNGVIAESLWGSSGQSWNFNQLPFESDWTNIGYYDATNTPTASMTESFVYAFASNGDLAYTSDYQAWTLYNSTTNYDHHISNISTDNIELSISSITNYVLNAIRMDSSNLVTVANDSERYLLSPADVTEGFIVIVTDTNKMYQVVDVNNLGSDEGYELCFYFSLDQIRSILDNMPGEMLITADEIRNNLAEIAALTSADVAVTVNDILKSLRYITQMKVSEIYETVTVANDAERFSLTPDRVTVGTIVRVTDTEMLYEVVDTMNLSNVSGYVGYGIPFYTLPKGIIRSYLPELSESQLRYTLTYLQNTGEYQNINPTTIEEYIEQIYDTSGIEGTGLTAVPENVIDGMLDYIMSFYMNPDYDGITDTRKYMYGIEDENRFDSNYANSTIFQGLYNEVIDDINNRRFERITQPIIEYIVEYIVNHMDSCITTDIREKIISDMKSAIIAYIETKVLPDNMSQESVDEVIDNIANEVLTNPTYANIIEQIKDYELFNALRLGNGAITWNRLTYLNGIRKFVALSTINIIAESVNLQDWTYHVSGEYSNFTDIVYAGGYVNKYIMSVKDKNYIAYSDNLSGIKTSNIPNSSNTVNNILWSDYYSRIYLSTSELGNKVYFGKFIDNNGVAEIAYEESTLEHPCIVKDIDYSNITNNYSLLTTEYSIYLGSASGTNSIYTYSWSVCDLANEKVILYAVDRYSGDYCAITNLSNIVIASPAAENEWSTRKINVGLDSLIATSMHLDTNSGDNPTMTPNVAIIQKYGQYKTTTDLINLKCHSLNDIRNWVSIEYSDEIEKYCVIDTKNSAILFSASGNDTEYAEIPYVSTEIADMIWLGGNFKMFMAITKNDEYLVSEDGLTWSKSTINSNTIHTKIAYDEDINKIFITSKKSDSILVLSEA